MNDRVLGLEIGADELEAVPASVYQGGAHGETVAHVEALRGELEGALRRLVANSQFMGAPISTVPSPAIKLPNRP